MTNDSNTTGFDPEQGWRYALGFADDAKPTVGQITRSYEKIRDAMGLSCPDIFRMAAEAGVHEMEARTAAKGLEMAVWMTGSGESVIVAAGSKADQPGHTPGHRVATFTVTPAGILEKPPVTPHPEALTQPAPSALALSDQCVPPQSERGYPWHILTLWHHPACRILAQWKAGTYDEWIVWEIAGSTLYRAPSLTAKGFRWLRRSLSLVDVNQLIDDAKRNG